MELVYYVSSKIFIWEITRIYWYIRDVCLFDLRLDHHVCGHLSHLPIGQILPGLHHQSTFCNKQQLCQLCPLIENGDWTLNFFGRWYSCHIVGIYQVRNDRDKDDAVVDISGEMGNWLIQSRKKFAHNSKTHFAGESLCNPLCVVSKQVYTDKGSWFDFGDPPLSYKCQPPEL